MPSSTLHYNLYRKLIASALALVLGACWWSLARAQASCVPGSGVDWMVSSDPLAARIRPADCVSVEQTPPDFGWPELSSDSQYFVTVTYPDGSTRTRTASQNWINWDEVLPAGTYTWTVQVSNSQGTQQSRARKFIVGPNATPFLVPDGPTMLGAVSTKAHPRSLPDAATLATMKSQRQQAVTDLYWDVSGRLTNPLPTDPVSSAYDAAFDASKYTLNALVNYVYNPADNFYADALRRVLNLASWNPTGSTAYTAPGMDMASRQIVWVLAWGYDILAPRLDSSQKAAILASIKQRTGDMYNDIIGTRSRVAAQPRDSHANQTLTVLAAVAALVAGDLPDAATWAQKALPQAMNAINPWGGEEGGFGNGSPQGVWDMGDTLPVWYALKRMTGLDFSQKAWVKEWARYLAYLNPPGMSGKGVFGDGLEYNETEHQARYGKGYTYFAPTPLGRWYASQLTGEDPTRIEYLMAPPADFTTAALPSGTPNSTLFPSTGVMAMHSDLSNNARTSVYFKSSPAPFGAYNHSHADQNSFVVDAGGQRLAIESGYYDDYKTAHWMQWYHQTRAKNAITYDGGKGQVFYEQDGVMGYGRINSATSQTGYDIVAGDATAAYGGALTKALRTLVYLRPNLILVYDNLASATPRQWEWNIHAVNMITQANDTQVSIQNGGQSLCVDMLAGPTMKFTQNNTFTALPTNGGAAQWHGKFYNTTLAGTAEFVALLRVGCQTTAASATKSNGVWTVNAGTNTVTIADTGAATVGPLQQSAASTASSTPFTGTPIAVPGTFEAENFDKGGQDVAYHDNTKNNQGGQYRKTEDVDIINSTDSAGGGYVINNFETGEWLKYTINVPSAGNYDIELRASTKLATSAYHVEIDNVDVTGQIAVPYTGDWTLFQWSGKKAVPLKAGLHVLKVYADRQYFNLNQIRLTAAPKSTPYSGTPVALPATFEAENFDKGGEGVAYHDNVAGNAGGQYRTTEDVDIVASTDPAGGGYVINNFETGEWLLYTVSVPSAGNYDINLRTATNFTTSAFHVEVDGVNVTGSIVVPYTNSWSAYQWVGKTGVPLSAGVHQLKVVADQQYFNLNQIQVLASGSSTTTSGTSTTTSGTSTTTSSTSTTTSGGGGTTTGGTGGTSSATPPSSLLFWSGFDGAITVSAPIATDCWGNGCWQNMTGLDTATGFTWPPTVNGGGGKFQLLTNPTAGAPADPSNVGNYMTNVITTVTGHKGTSTRALLSTITQSGCCGTNSQNPSGSTQDPFMILPTSDVGEMYISQWIYMEPGLKQQLGPNNWRAVFEWKTTDTDFRMAVVIKTDASGNIYWATLGDSYVPSYHEIMRANNTTVPVPAGQWFKLEVYWKRASSGGRLWAAINGQVIGDLTGNTIGPNGSRMDRLFLTQVYSGGTYPIYQYFDDIQIWSTFPTAGATDAWYDPPYAAH